MTLGDAMSDSDEVGPLRVVLVRLDRETGEATFVRSDGKHAVVDVGFRTEPSSAIVAMSWSPIANLLVFETDRHDYVMAELPTITDPAPLAGRPVVYLDQNHWSTLANAVHAPERVPAHEIAHARELIELARTAAVILPLSAGHMSETCKWTDRDRRYHLALTIVQLSRGWQMRDPLELRTFEIREAILMRYRDRAPAPLRPFTLEPDALHAARHEQGARIAAPADFPEDVALTFRATTSIAAAFDTMLDAESIDIGTSPGWVDRLQRFTSWLASEPRTDRHLRHLRTDAFFICDLIAEIPVEFHAAGLTPDDMSDWTLNHSAEDVTRMASLAVFREAMREKLLNPGTRWESNDLTDLIYLSCAVGYADHVVAERSLAAHVRSGLDRLGRPINVVTSIRDLMDLLA